MGYTPLGVSHNVASGVGWFCRCKFETKLQLVSCGSEERDDEQYRGW